jgi:hypothetical protein
MEEKKRSDSHPVDQIVVIYRENLSTAILEAEGLVYYGNIEVPRRKFPVIENDLAHLEGRDNVYDTVSEFLFNSREFTLRQGKDREKQHTEGNKYLFHDRNN